MSREIDPICGMTVDPATAAASFEYEGKCYYFCSTHCLRKFRENPERFAHKQANMTQVHDAPHMKADAHPLETAAAYTCPMHTEVRQDKPGSCPRCGMALEPLTVT